MSTAATPAPTAGANRRAARVAATDDDAAGALVDVTGLVPGATGENGITVSCTGDVATDISGSTGPSCMVRARSGHHEASDPTRSTGGGVTPWP